jgi:hypothetical protein
MNVNQGSRTTYPTVNDRAAARTVEGRVAVNWRGVGNAFVKPSHAVETKLHIDREL